MKMAHFKMQTCSFRYISSTSHPQKTIHTKPMKKNYISSILSLSKSLDHLYNGVLTSLRQCREYAANLPLSTLLCTTEMPRSQFTHQTLAACEIQESEECNQLGDQGSFHSFESQRPVVPCALHATCIQPSPVFECSVKDVLSPTQSTPGNAEKVSKKQEHKDSASENKRKRNQRRNKSQRAWQSQVSFTGFNCCSSRAKAIVVSSVGRFSTRSNRQVVISQRSTKG